MKLSITIDCDNDAFDPHWQDEAARILHSLAEKLEVSGSRFIPMVLQLNDSNGNNVGCMEVGL